jgi:hypothetical protein
MRLPLWKFIQNRKYREIASWLGGGAVVIVGGIWGLFTYLFPHDDKKPVAPPATVITQPGPQVGAGRDIVAGRDVVINVRLPYLKDMYLMNGVLREGWYYYKRPDELLNSQNSQSEPLQIYPIGSANHRLGFLVASKTGTHSKVNKLYLKLKGYAFCGLRDERTEVLAFMRETMKRFFISEEFDTYPIYPLNENLSVSS